MRRMQQSRFLYILLLVITGLSTSQCTDSEIAPLDESYKPDQPIEFPHEIHVSKGIDCKYCHNSANEEKDNGIPAVNVCMKCHKEEKGKNVE